MRSPHPMRVQGPERWRLPGGLAGREQSLYILLCHCRGSVDSAARIRCCRNWPSVRGRMCRSSALLAASRLLQLAPIRVRASGCELSKAASAKVRELLSSPQPRDAADRTGRNSGATRCRFVPGSDARFWPRSGVSAPPSRDLSGSDRCVRSGADAARVKRSRPVGTGALCKPGGARSIRRRVVPRTGTSR